MASLFQALRRRLVQGGIVALKSRILLVFALALGVSASGGAYAAAGDCAVSVYSIMGQTAVLQADCGNNVSTITWKRNGVDLTGELTLTSTSAPIHYTTPLLSGANTYTATSSTGSGAGPIAATITGAVPTLTVAGNVGGSVTSTPAGITCTDGAGTCAYSSFAAGSAVVLRAVADGTHSFSGWGGDCSGTGTCTVAMNTSRTVTATFGDSPVNGTCAAPGGSATTPSPLCVTGTATSVADPGTASAGNWTWGCNGANGGTGTSSTACSAPKIVAGTCGTASGGTSVSTTPTGTAACSTGTATGMTPGTSQFTWTCAGFNGGQTSGQCAVNITLTNGVCGTANGTNVAAAPTGAAACSAGDPGTVTNPSNTYSWTCNGLAGGSSQQCTANQIVNGACGSSNGGSFATAPATNLCSAGNATAVAGSGPFTWSCTGINTGTTASCSASLNTSAQCSAPASGTLVYSTTDLDNYTPRGFHYTFNTPGMSLDSKVLASAPKAYAFINNYSPTSKASGRIAVEDGNRGSGLKDLAVSECPGQYDNLPAGCSVSNTLTGGVYWSHDGAKYAGLFTACKIEPGKTYYLNIRTHAGTSEAGFLLRNQ